MKALWLAIIIALAIISGLSLGLFGINGIAVLLPVLLLVALLSDYRVGVVFMIFAIPFWSSPFLPKAQHLNPIAFAIVGSVTVLLAGKLIRKEAIVWPPRVIIYCLVFPIIVGFLNGTRYIDIGAKNIAFSHSPDAFQISNYSRDILIKPLVFLIFSFLVANAVNDSKKPATFLYIFALSSIVPVAYLFFFVATAGVSLGDHRILISKLGMHYNEYSKLLAITFGPLLYMTMATRGVNRVVFGFLAAVVVLGIGLTFARSGYMALVIISLVILWQKRSWKIGLAALIFLSASMLFAPSAWQDRMTQGLNSTEVVAAKSGDFNERFSSGRLAFWMKLAPDIALSPLIGRGTGSTTWSPSITRGTDVGGHPHNLYLQILLDLGIIGLVLIGYLYYSMYMIVHRLSKSAEIDELSRAFFAGASASFIGLLFISFTGGYWYPHVEQSFLWVIFGIALAYDWRMKRVKSSIGYLSHLNILNARGIKV